MLPINAERNAADRKPTDNDIHNLLWAAYKSDEAEQYWAELLSAKNVSPQVYRGYLPFLQKNKKHHEILKLMPIVDQYFTDDPGMQMIIIEALDRTGQQKYAVQRLAALHAKVPSHPESALFLAQAHLNNRDPNNALGVINTFLANSQNKHSTFIFHFLKAQIYMQMNKKEDALEAIKSCLAAHRNFEKGWLLYALLEETLGNIEEAIKGYTTFLDITGNDRAVQNKLLQLLFKQKMLSGNTTSMNVSFPCLQKAILLFENNQPHEALKQVEECLKTHPKDGDARILKIQALTSLEEYDKAFDALKTWIVDDPKNEEWYATLSLVYKKSDIKKKDYLHVLTDVAKKYPRELLPQMYLADAYLRMNKYEDAIAHLNNVIEKSDDNSVKAKACYQIGRIYYQQQRYADMVSICQKGLNFQKDFAPICNMLAYYYAGKGNDKVQAHKLLQNALLDDPSNNHYQHTAAYLAYKDGNYQKALSIIQPLAMHELHDTFIAKHYQKINAKIAQQKNGI